MATASDNFTRANETPLAGNWDNPACGGSNNKWNLSSNALVPNGLGDDAHAIWKTSVNDFGDDQFSECVVSVTGTAGSGAGAGVAVRHNGLGQTHGVSTYRLVADHAGGNNVEIAKFVSDSYTQLVAFTQAFTNGDTFRLEVNGTTLEAFYLGGSLGTHTDSSITTGQPGLVYSSTETATTLDLWQGGDLASFNPPVVEGTAETAVTTAGTSHAITLPASIASTDGVLIVMDIGSTSATFNSLANWTELLDEASANGLKAWWYTGTGVPGNPTFTSSASTRSATIAYRISNTDRSLTPVIGTTASGSSTTPDPPSVTPSGGPLDFLAIAFLGRGGEEADDDTWATAAPSGYTNLLQKACGTVGTNLGGIIAAAQKQANFTTENPGTFTIATGAWRAQTIVVYPPAASGPQTVTPSGLGSAQAFGTVSLKFQVPGLGSAQAFGTVKANQTYHMTGLGSAQAFGTVTALPGNVNKTMVGLTSAQAFGTITPVPGGVSKVMTGLGSAQAFGTIQANQKFSVTGLGSAQAFGLISLKFQVPSLQSAAAFGTLIGIAIQVPSLGSAQAFGTVTASTTGGGQSVSATGLGSAQAFGTPTIHATITVVLVGLGSAQAFGSPQENIRFTVSGVPSAQAFGTPTILTGNVNVPINGLGSAQVFGAPGVTTTGGGPAFLPHIHGVTYRRRVVRTF